MKTAILFCALALSAHAQTTANPTAPAAQNPPAVAATPEAAPLTPVQAEAKFRADVLQFVELTGAREQVKTVWKSMVDEGRKQMAEQCELCSQKFTNEWTKRMLAQIKTDDLIAIWVNAYARHFTQDDITALIDFQRKTNAHEKAQISTDVAAKFQAQMPAVTNEFNGECAKLNGDLAGKITNDIQQEHPEYLNASDKNKQ